MRRVYIALSALFLLVGLSLSAADYTRSGQTVTIKLDAASKGMPSIVQLEVVNPNIIRVRATPQSSLPEKESLMIVPQNSVTHYDVMEEGGKLIVATSNVRAVVDERTGRVEFHDASGRLLLREAENGKTFRPFTVPEREIGVGRLTDYQKNALSWRLVFDSPADEAFYGLGQHQANEMNYKGKNEELFQYNTKISVPFVMSSKGYGILWDSYSYCRWGNPDDYLQLDDAFTLYDKDGVRGAITGTYTDGENTLVRREDSLYFENSETIVNLPKGISFKKASVVYEGSLEAPVDNDYHFNVYFSGYAKVFIDGKEVLPEVWRAAWNPNARKFVYPMRKGGKYCLRIEWKPDGSVAYISCRVSTPRTESEQNQASIWSEMARDMDYYFIAGKTMDEVISGYRTLTGKAQVMPKWALGFWQSRERYKTSADIENTLSEFRRRHIPIDNIVQDWNYWPDPDWGEHNFEASRYPNPQAMLDSVHAMHGRFMISVWPKFYVTTRHYKELDANGWMYHQSVKDSIRDWVGPGYLNSFYDAYAPGARKLFWKQMNDALYTKYNRGIDAWWMDASEPNVRDCTPMWYRKALSGPTYLGSSTEYFNAYSLVNAMAIYEGQRSVSPNTRVFLLTRSGFAGLQRYSTASWSGDIAARWEDMRAQMTAGLNYSMSGIPFWGMDQGGFTVEDRYIAAQRLFDRTGEENEDLKEWRELQTRWNEFGCFIPLYRTHGQWPLREVWNIAPEDHPAYKAIVWYDKLRYRMMPYLYSMAGWVNIHDYTIMRGLAMDFGSDSSVFNIGDQWMFGPSLMACPVGYYKARSREVYLPNACGWYDFYSGRHFDGGRAITADAPYERIPVFVPEGAIIPFGPEIEWSDEKKPELINLYVYAGRDGEFELYEDEGTNYNYEKGMYSTIRFSYNDSNRTLTIGDRKGSFDGMLSTRRFNIVLVSKEHARPLDLDNPSGKMVRYKGKSVTVSLE